MIYHFKHMSKTQRKGSGKAADLLHRIAEAGGLPVPLYEYEHRGRPKRPDHFCKVRLRIPSFLTEKRGLDLLRSTIVGSGTGGTKVQAKKMASLEAVHRMEDELGYEKQGDLKRHVERLLEERQKEIEALEATPVEEEIVGVDWSNVPIDTTSFPEILPASRRGRIEFFPEVLADSDAFLAAKALALGSGGRLPEITVHSQQTDTMDVRRYANIRYSGTRGKTITYKRLSDIDFNLSPRDAELAALKSFGKTLQKNTKKMERSWREIVPLIRATGTDSFGMAKLVCSIPKHLHDDLNALLDDIPDLMPTSKQDKQYGRKKNESGAVRQYSYRHNDEKGLESRLHSFRAHQQRCPLPIDSVEGTILHEADVTIVRGGTGSGKTTRYPLMLSLQSPDVSTKVVVAQPRRLACQAAARRVAQEQDSRLGEKGCPIGYAIRFESARSWGIRTVDFMTPGVLLRRAIDDPVLEGITHLVLDEIHERNADIDLLLALAKHAMKARKATRPLHLVLMSATLDSSHWEAYFGNSGVSVEFVNVPEIRKFPIKTIHLGDPEASKYGMSAKSLQRESQDYDEALCEMMANLAWRLIQQERFKGSILCFLPGMEEIFSVHNFLRRKGKNRFTVQYLHSSLTSREQDKVFLPGNKVILSTNLAEASLTIPDVVYVIDTGRERQHALMDSSGKSPTTTVVGSQLATVNISQASAKQRTGRAGRVAAGTCFRLYTKEDLETTFPVFTKPEMQRMDLSQLVLHTLSMYSGGHPLQLLLDAPDPPSNLRLKQSLRALLQQGHIECSRTDESINLTPLGKAVASLPVTPRLGRLLFLGLALRAIEPALCIASLLSVPKLLGSTGRRLENENVSSSDIVDIMNSFNDFVNSTEVDQRMHPNRKLFKQVDRVKRQLDRNLRELMGIEKSKRSDDKGWDPWNTNSDRIASIVGLICGATPHIAHLVAGRSNFATRDLAGSAFIHPNSVNFGNDRRCHWYVYNELLQTKRPFLSVTTAVSPMELAFFADSTAWAGHHFDDEFEFLFGSTNDMMNHTDECDDDDGEDTNDRFPFISDEDVFIADQWVPVVVPSLSQKETLLKVRGVLNDMIQELPANPQRVLESSVHHRIILYLLAAIEHQRVPK